MAGSVADTDPVKRFFRELEDPALYERVDDVPVFVPNVRLKKGGDGQWRKIEVTDSDLKEIEDTVRSMEDDRGVLPIITPGHRKRDPGADERDQPPPWGYCRDVRRGHYTTPAGKKVKTLLASFYFRRDLRDRDGTPVAQAARTYPFRSVDYYPDRKQVTGVSLLRRDPELDLGMVAYGASDGRVYTYASENVMPDTMPPTTAPDARDTPGTMAELSPEEAGTAMRYASHYEKHHPAFKYMCGQYAASQGAAGAGAGAGGGGGAPASLSGTNGAMPPATPPSGGGAPTPPKKEPPMDYAGTLTPEQYQRELKARDEKIAASDQRIQALEVQLGQQTRAARLAQYHRELEELAVDRPSIKPDAIMPMVENHTPAQFAEFKKMLQATVPAAPVGRWPDIYSRNGHANGVEGANGGTTRAVPGRLTEDQQEQVFQYVRENPGVDYDVAVKKLFPN